MYSRWLNVLDALFFGSALIALVLVFSVEINFRGIEAKCSVLEEALQESRTAELEFDWLQTCDLENHGSDLANRLQWQEFAGPLGYDYFLNACAIIVALRLLSALGRYIMRGRFE